VYFGRESAVLAAALATFWLPLVNYSVNARGYTIQACFIAWVFSDLEYLCRGVSGRLPLVTGLFLGLSFWTIPTTAFALLAICLYLTLRCRRRLLNRNFVAMLFKLVGSCVLVTALLYAPILIRPGNSLFSNPWVQPLPWPEFWRLIGGYPFKVWHWIAGQPGQEVQYLMLASMIIACVGYKYSPTRRGMLLIASLLTASAVLIVARRIIPFERVFLFVVPCMLGTVAAGIVIAIRFAVTQSRLLPKARVLISATAITIALAGSAHHQLFRSSITLLPAGTPANGLRQVATYLVEQVEEGGMILAGIPTKCPLRLYLKERGGDPTIVNRNVFLDTNKVSTVHVVVDKEQRSLEMFLELSDSPREMRDQSSHVAAIGGYDIYLVECTKPFNSSHGYLKLTK
jgi:hypothetical protein